MRQANAFLHSCWFNYFQTLGGRRNIHYVSPVPGINPGWYIWPDSPGVYELSLLEFEQGESRETSRFALKYFPHRETSELQDFSFAEQIVRLSYFFDDSFINEKQDPHECCCAGLTGQYAGPRLVKGIPKLHLRNMMHPSLFWVGELCFLFDANQLLQVSLCSQDRLLQYAVDGVYIQETGLWKEVVKPGGLDRQVPGWKLSKQFFDLFIDEVLFALGLIPLRYDESIRPGQIFYHKQEGDGYTEESSKVNSIIQKAIFMEV